MSINNLSYSWPSDFPVGVPENCGVIPAQGKVYRLVRTIPPTELDFQKHRDEKPDYEYRSKDIPKSYGVSFWSTLSTIRQAEKNYPAPEQYGKWQTVCGTLFPALGVITETAETNGHITLWVQKGAEPHKHIKDEVKES